MSDLIITREDIMMSVCNLADKLSNTPDGIPSYFLKRVAPAIIDFLTHLFNVSPTTGTVPNVGSLLLLILFSKKVPVVYLQIINRFL